MTSVWPSLKDLTFHPVRTGLSGFCTQFWRFRKFVVQVFGSSLGLYLMWNWER